MNLEFRGFVAVSWFKNIPALDYLVNFLAVFILGLKLNEARPKRGHNRPT